VWSGERTAPAGLCPTCKFRRGCVFREKRGVDALYCEMFEHRAFGDGPEGQPSARENDTGGDGGARGLCATCAGAATCAHPRPEAGIWHCEEYT